MQCLYCERESNVYIVREREQCLYCEGESNVYIVRVSYVYIVGERAMFVL